MEKVITNELVKFLLILGAAVVTLSVCLTKMVTSVRGSFKPYRKQTLLYLLAALFFYGMVACAAHPAVISDTMPALVFFQAYFLLIGSVHIYLMRQKMKWSGDDKAFYLDLIFTLLVSVLGCILFVLVYRLMNANGLQYVMMASILFFVLPFLFYYTFKKAMAIPPKILKEWYYPVHQEIEEPDDSKLKNLLVISFEFPKRAGDHRATIFRAKAPADMEFGQLFYYFLNDYNERHPNGKVQLANENGEPNGWIFYRKPDWYSLMTRYIDTDKTVLANRIRENEIIICSRSMQ
jgi:hypothetical protein